MFKINTWDLPVVNNPPANVGNMGSIPGLGRSYIPCNNEAHMLQLPEPRSSRAHAPE